MEDIDIKIREDIIARRIKLIKTIAMPTMNLLLPSQYMEWEICDKSLRCHLKECLWSAQFLQESLFWHHPATFSDTHHSDPVLGTTTFATTAVDAYLLSGVLSIFCVILRCLLSGA